MVANIEHGSASDLKINSVTDKHIEERTAKNKDQGQRGV